MDILSGQKGLPGQIFQKLKLELLTQRMTRLHFTARHHPRNASNTARPLHA
jgi:hypothetical protein